jgi:AmmeMemoRadiSam system protein B
MRKPAVANVFYHGAPERLRKQVQGLVEKDAEKIRVLGAVSPHAGFVYSGGVAGAVYSRIEFPKTIILMGPDHGGFSDRASVVPDGFWEMPGGSVEIESPLASKLLERSSFFRDDRRAHKQEHSLEVQLPFIQYFIKEFKILPILFSRCSLEQCEESGAALAEMVKEAEQEVLIVASSDMSHYENHETAKLKDGMAIDRIISMDHEGLYRTVVQENITMCGFIPTTVMMVACKELGAGETRLVKYQTSGEISGDFQRVVGYAGLLVS